MGEEDRYVAAGDLLSDSEAEIAEDGIMLTSSSRTLIAAAAVAGSW